MVSPYSFIVASAPDVLVDDTYPGRLLREFLAIQLVLEDRLDALIRVGLQNEGTGTGGLEPFFPVAPCQPHDAEAGAEALLGVRPSLHDLPDEFRCGRT